MDLRSILESVKEISLETGDFIRKEAVNFNKEHIEHKGFNDLVSYVDKTAEKQLVTGLSKVLPNSGFIAEEGTATHNNETYKWIIDPLDGTTNFLHGVPTFAVSIALQKEDETILGLVYEINRDECFYAISNEQAECNGRAIHVSTSKNLSTGLIATGFPYHDFERMPSYLAMLNDFMQGCHGVRRIGSAATDLAYVACGRFEAFFEYNLNPWDVAGGAFVVKQAGGEATDFYGGNDYMGKRQILASCGINDQMKEIIHKHWL